MDALYWSSSFYPFVYTVADLDGEIGRHVSPSEAPSITIALYNISVSYRSIALQAY